MGSIDSRFYSIAGDGRGAALARPPRSIVVTLPGSFEITRESKVNYFVSDPLKLNWPAPKIPLLPGGVPGDASV
jgi:hypothetical protein